MAEVLNTILDAVPSFAEVGILTLAMGAVYLLTRAFGTENPRA